MEMIAAGMDDDQIDVIRQRISCRIWNRSGICICAKDLDWKQMTQLFYCLKDGLGAGRNCRAYKAADASQRISEMP